MIIGNKEFKNYTFVMAILNVTPDSFFPDSRSRADDVLYKVEQMIRDGAAVIDVGAQSTRPGYVEVPPEEEIERLADVIVKIKRNFNVPVSVDTYFASVASEALKLGADMINDVHGLGDSGMADVIAANNASVCIMHNAPRKICGDVFPPVISFLSDAANAALAAGIQKDRICLDGGVGFAKDVGQCMQLIRGYERLSSIGYPLLLGASRKSFMGGSVDKRLQPTLETTRMAAQKGVLFVRVHDVKQNVQVIKEEYERNRN